MAVRFLISLWMLIIGSQSFAQFEKEGRSIVRKLASPSMKGRGYVEKGDAKAANYIIDYLTKSSVAPLGKKDYRQPYSFSANYFPDKMILQVNGQKLRPGIDFLVGAANPSLKGYFLTLVVKRRGLLEYETLSAGLAAVQNRLVYIDNQEDSTETKFEKEIIDYNLHYLLQDTSLRVKGFLLYSPRKLTWTVYDHQNRLPVFDLHQSLKSIAQSTVYVDTKAQFDSVYHTQNIIASIPGTRNNDSCFVFSAHYDHLGMMGNKTVFPGANDNASGTALVLTLAHYFAQHPLPYKLIFCFFSGEEIGLKGSKYLSEHSPFTLSQVRFLFNLDMAGTGQNGIQVVNATKFLSDWHLLERLNDSAHFVKQVLPRGEAANSDHYWFYRKGVPSFFAYTLGGVHYHDVADTYCSLPFTAFDGYARLLIQFAENVCK